MSQLLRSTLIYGLGQVLNRFLSFLLLPLFTRFLSPADYGITAMLSLLTMVCQVIFSWGLGTSIGLCYFDQSQRPARVLGNALLILALSGGLMIGLGLLGIETLNTLLFKQERYHYLILVTLISTALGLLTTPMSLYMQLADKAKSFVLLSQVNTVVTTALCVWMVVGLRAGVKGYIEAYLLSQLLSLVLNALVVLRHRALDLRLDRVVCRELLHLGIPQIMAFWGMFILFHSQKYIIQHFYDLKNVGLYSTAYNFSNVIFMLVNSFAIAWTPYMWSVAKDPEHAPQVFGRIASYYFLTFGTLATLVCLVARSVVLLMTAPEFHSIYPLIGICSFAQICYGAYSIQATEAFLAKDSLATALIQLGGGLLSLPLSLVLIAYGGASGAAWSMLIGFLLLLLIQHRVNQRKSAYLGIRYEGRRLGLATLLFAGLSAPFMLARNWGLGLELTAAGAAGLLLVILLYRLILPEERVWLKHYVAARLSRSHA